MRCWWCTGGASGPSPSWATREFVLSSQARRRACGTPRPSRVARAEPHRAGDRGRCRRPGRAPRRVAPARSAPVISAWDRRRPRSVRPAPHDRQRHDRILRVLHPAGLEGVVKLEGWALYLTTSGLPSRPATAEEVGRPQVERPGTRTRVPLVSVPRSPARKAAPISLGEYAPFDTRIRRSRDSVDDEIARVERGVTSVTPPGARPRCYEYREGSAVPYTDDREEFHGAVRRLRRLLFGDDMDVPGRLKGEDARAQAKRDLRRMRDAFDAVVARSEESSTEKADVEARVADLQEELTQIAASKASQARGVIPPPKEPKGGRAGTSKTRAATSKTRPRSPKRKRKA